MAKNIKIYSWNVNGIRAVLKKGLLEWMSSAKPDILCLQETKAHFEQLPGELKEIKGYKSYFHSAKKKGYSGVAIYSKLEPDNVLTGIGNNYFDDEYVSEDHETLFVLVSPQQQSFGGGWKFDPGF